MEKLAKRQFETFSAKPAGSDLAYLIDSVQPIDEEFTNNTFAEADRVKEQLRTNLSYSYSAEFDYQGSVTSDTHIRIHSDIDLLAMHGGFVSFDAGVPLTAPYAGNVLGDLTSMRRDSARILSAKFPAAAVDDSPGKAISVEGGSLRRKVDVIVGNWWDTELYKRHKVKMARGIQLVDTKVPTLIRNKPFWHNYEIDQKDKKTGGLRKVIRLLKTLKYDAEPEVGMSSYDIAAVAWNMQATALTVSPYAYTQLATNAKGELKRFIDNDNVRSSLAVPNGTRPVFGSGGATLEGLRNLYRELDDLISRVTYENIINFSKSSSFPTPPRAHLWEERRPSVVVKHSY